MVQWELNKEGQEVNKVVVHGFLARALRPHQREGVKFLYECVMGMRGSQPGQFRGALLADEMGLGKTLQCIALIWYCISILIEKVCTYRFLYFRTLLNQKAYGRGADIRRALIVTPSSLVENWERDIYAWLGYRRLSVYKVDAVRAIQYQIVCKTK